MNKSELIEFNIKTKEKQIKSSYLYVFDQILTLYRYIIKQIDDGDRKSLIAFTQRLRFIGAMKKHFLVESHTCSDGLYKLQQISKWLDSGAAALDIIDKVKRDDVFIKHDSNYLTSIIENEAIIFAKSNKSHAYSFFAMHAALKDPIAVFQNFLKLPSTARIIDIAIGHCLFPYKNLYENNDSQLNQVLNGPMSRPKSVKVPALCLNRARDIHDHGLPEIEAMIQEYGDGQYALKKDDLSMNIENAIDELLRNWAEQVFKTIDPRSKDVTQLFGDFLDTSELGNTNQMTVNPEKLELLCLLGQSESIGELIAKKIKAHFVKDEHIKDSLLNKEADCLTKLSRWFNASQSGYIKRVDQIPAHIATILNWRVSNLGFAHYATFSVGEPIELSSRKTIEQCQETVTALIKYFLYHDNTSPSLLMKKPYSEKRIISIDDYLEHLMNLSTERKLNTLMEEWTTFESIKTRNRFKRPLQDLKNNLYTVDKRLESQQQKSLNHPFPSHFPVPLWINDYV